MELSISGEVAIQFRNVKDGNEITSTMKSGELVIGDVITPFVLQKLNWGNIEKMSTEHPSRASIACFKQRKTTFTKQGYVSLLLTLSGGQTWVYVKKEKLKDFFAAFCIAAI